MSGEFIMNDLSQQYTLYCDLLRANHKTAQIISYEDYQMYDLRIKTICNRITRDSSIENIIALIEQLKEIEFVLSKGDLSIAKYFPSSMQPTKAILIKKYRSLAGRNDEAENVEEDFISSESTKIVEEPVSPSRHEEIVEPPAIDSLDVNGEVSEILEPEIRIPFEAKNDIQEVKENEIVGAIDAITKIPDKPEGEGWQDDQLTSQQVTDKCQEVRNKVVDKNKNTANNYNLEELKKKSDYKWAKKEMDQAAILINTLIIQKGCKDIEYYLRLAECYKNQNEIEAATDIYQSVLKKDRHNKNANDFLAIYGKGTIYRYKDKVFDGYYRDVGMPQIVDAPLWHIDERNKGK